MCSTWQCAFAEFYIIHLRNLVPYRRKITQQATGTNSDNDKWYPPLPLSWSRLYCRAPSCWNSVACHIIVRLPIPLPRERAALVRKALHWTKITNKNIPLCCRTKSSACKWAASMICFHFLLNFLTSKKITMRYRSPRFFFRVIHWNISHARSDGCIWKYTLICALKVL